MSRRAKDGDARALPRVKCPDCGRFSDIPTGTLPCSDGVAFYFCRYALTTCHGGGKRARNAVRVRQWRVTDERAVRHAEYVANRIILDKKD